MSFDFDSQGFDARAIARDLLPQSASLALGARALKGMLAELCVAEAVEISEDQASLIRSAALEIAVSAIHIVAGADKLLLLAKLARSREPPASR